MPKELSKSEREAIIATLKQAKVLATAHTVESAIAWSDEHPETKPHFLVHKDGGHVIIY